MKTIYVKIQVQDDFKEPAKAIQGIVDSDGWGFPFADIEQIALPSDNTGTCEWNKSPLLNGWFCECDDDAPSIPNYKYIKFTCCPFCGRKIERV